MSDKKIHIRGKMLTHLQPGQAPIIRLKADAYNMLVDIANESVSPIGVVASEIIRQAIEGKMIEIDRGGEE